jgi:hypothetical protein
MSTIPTIQDLKDRFLANIMAELDITLNPVGMAFLTIFAGVLAGMLYPFYLLIGMLQRDQWVDLCSLEMLKRYGRIILGRNMFAARKGKYKIAVTGVIGATVPATQVYKSDDSSFSPGKLFQIVGGAYTLISSPDYITVQALEGGLSSRLQVGDTLTAVSPIVNVDAGATVAVESTVPIDAETESEYRKAAIDKIQLEPGSWSAVDYRIVGDEVAGVLQTYAYADSGTSSVVDVYLQGEVPGTPIGGSIITDYQTALELVLPLDVWDVNYAGSTINTIDITVHMGTFTPYTTAQKALIDAALDNFINSVRPFIASCDAIDERNDVIALYNLSSVIAGAVPGYGFSSVTFDVNSTPSTFFQADNGQIAFRTSTTYV